MKKLLVNAADYIKVLHYIESRGKPVYWYSLRDFVLHDSDPTPVVNPNRVLTQLLEEGFLDKVDEKYLVLSTKGHEFLQRQL